MKNNHVAKLSLARLSLLVWWALVGLAIAASVGGCDQTTVLQAGITWEKRPDQDRAAYLIWKVAYEMPEEIPGVGWVDVMGRPDECWAREFAGWPDHSPAYGWWSVIGGKTLCQYGDTVEGDWFSQVAVDDRDGLRKVYQTGLAHEWCHIMAVTLDGDGDGDHNGRCKVVDGAPAPGGKMALAYELLYEEGI